MNNFTPHEVVDHGSETELQVGEKISSITLVGRGLALINNLLQKGLKMKILTHIQCEMNIH